MSVNNTHAYFFLFLFISFYDDRGEPFCETVNAHYLALSFSNYFAYQQHRAQTSEKEARLAIKQTSNISLE